MRRDELARGQAQAKAQADRRHHLRIASTLAHYLHEGGAYGFEEHLPGSGADVAHGRVRFCIEVDGALFWRTYARIERSRGGR
jgi:hypothetical protein